MKTLVAHRLMFGHLLGIEGLTLNELLRTADIEPHGVRLRAPDLRRESHSLALTVRGRGRAPLFHAMFNAYWEPLSFELPALGPDVGGSWRHWIDTSREAPRRSGAS